jgi:hypothetical protein
VLFGDYAGWAFAGWLTFNVALLSDLLLNRARITSKIMSSLGSVNVTPC